VLVLQQNEKQKHKLRASERLKKKKRGVVEKNTKNQGQRPDSTAGG
jgi:hypothetical protein